MFKKEGGQAIVLIALMLVVLLGFVALAIDGGNAYTQKREAQNAADAAALAGARQLALECAKTTGQNESNIRQAIIEMVQINDPGATPLAYFTFENGTKSACAIGSCLSVVCGCPNRYTGVEVNVTGVTDSFLAGFLGQQSLQAKAAARASYGTIEAFNTGVYPITRRYDPNLVYNQQVQIRVTENWQSETPGNFGWLRWPQANGGVPALVASLTPPGNSYLYENPGTLENNWNDANPNDHVIATGKWVRGKPGNLVAVRPELENLILTNETIIIPLYDTYDGQGVNAKFRVAAFAAFEMECYHLNNGQIYGNCIHTGAPNDKWVEGKFKRWVLPNGQWGAVPCTADTGLWSVKLVPMP